MKQKACVLKTQEGDLRIHSLKVWNEFWDVLITSDLSRRKTFEVRKFDRDFRVGDYLYLQNYNNESKKYLGNDTWKKITYILNDERFLPQDIVVLGIIDEIPKIRFTK